MRELVKTEIADELDKSADDAADDNEFLSAYLKSHADKQTASRAGKIKEILNNSDTPLDDLTKNMDIWGEKIPDKTSLRETVQFSNAIARGIYAAYGIQRLKWVAAGSKSCPYCQSLDGRTVGIEEVFLGKGVDYQPDGADEPLPITSNLYHPPAHDTCTCQIMAE